METAIAFVLCLGAGTVGGVFFAFSTFVMKAIREQPANQGIAVMRRINVVVLNPMFLGVFMGTALAALAGFVVAVFSWGTPRALLLLVSATLYLAGSWVVTMLCNVPRNERLARLEPESTDAARYWPDYVAEWTYWNHVRTIASLASAASAAGALTV